MSFSVKTLETLPVELLYEIHFYALSEHLPLTCKRLHAVFKHAPPSVHVTYLIGRHRSYLDENPRTSQPAFLTRILRYPLATRPVLTSLLAHPATTSCPHLFSKPPLLPRRLFRPLAPRTPRSLPLKDRHEPLPFLKFLYEHPTMPRPCTNAHEGYALTRAVLSGFVPLIQFLLENGADPMLKDGIAVKLAIQMQDLGLMKMLIERGTAPSTASSLSVSRRLSFGPAQGGPQGTKRRKMEDRVMVTPMMLRTAVKHGAMDIASWMMSEKGCVPDIHTVNLMVKRSEQ